MSHNVSIIQTNASFINETKCLFLTLLSDLTLDGAKRRYAVVWMQIT